VCVCVCVADMEASTDVLTQLHEIGATLFESEKDLDSAVRVCVSVCVCVCGLWCGACSCVIVSLYGWVSFI
jgi:hypothetical protein